MLMICLYQVFCCCAEVAFGWKESAVLRCDFWLERGRKDAVVLRPGEQYLKQMVLVRLRR